MYVYLGVNKSLVYPERFVNTGLIYEISCYCYGVVLLAHKPNIHKNRCQ